MSGTGMKDFIEEFIWSSFTGGGLGTRQIVTILGAACLIGLYIFVIYKGFSKAAFYSRDLNITMAGMCITVAAIMIAMQANLLVSLGMVGALSIVRFRTAVKNPLDLLYLFWSISAGIICGVGLYTLAAVLCVLMTFLIWILGKVPASRAPVVLLLRLTAGADTAAVEKIINSRTSYSHLSSILTGKDEVESVYEIRCREPLQLVQLLRDAEGVVSVQCLEHDGEVRG